MFERFAEIGLAVCVIATCVGLLALLAYILTLG
jgi:hypothetical protein